MGELRFAASKDTVVVFRDGKPINAMPWDFALELGRAYQDVGEKATRSQCIERRVRHGDEDREIRAHITDRDELRVLSLSRGIVTADLTPEDALAIGNTMINRARLAEEHVKYEKVIADQALMMRLGGQVSLSGDPDINDEAWEEAETDPTLRKNIPTPSSIKSKESFGYPQVKKLTTPEEKVENMTSVERAALRRRLMN